MGALDWTVVAAGAAAILWVNWYFFLAEGRGDAAGAVRVEARDSAGGGERPIGADRPIDGAR